MVSIIIISCFEIISQKQCYDLIAICGLCFVTIPGAFGVAIVDGEFSAVEVLGTASSAVGAEKAGEGITLEVIIPSTATIVAKS